MKTLADLIRIYAALEGRIQKRMDTACREHCVRCGTPCCKVVYCQEALESPFLTQVRQQFAAAAAWNDATGWLTPTGCGLPAGRPPVCYEFICAPIAGSQASAGHAQALDELAMLISRAGRAARGRRHLVELDALARLNLQRLASQFAAAGKIMDSLERDWDEPWIDRFERDH